MPQTLLVLQSLWAMERRRPGEPEMSLPRQLEAIHRAGFDGAGVRFVDATYAAEATAILRDMGLVWQAQCYPRTVDDLRPVLDLVSRYGADHVNLQPDVRPHRLEECLPYLIGWQRLAAQAGVALHVETHRDRWPPGRRSAGTRAEAQASPSSAASLSRARLTRLFTVPGGHPIRAAAAS